MAKINMERDIYAVDEDSETIYMYMSHFVDIKMGILQNVYPEFSNDGYFSAWIVNDDRDAYDSYLKSVYFGEAFKNAAYSLKAIYDTATNAEALSEIAGATWQIVLRSLGFANDTYGNAKNVNEQFSSYIYLYNNADNFQELVKAMEKAHNTEDYDSYAAQNGFGLFVNILAFTTAQLNMFGLVPSALSVGELYFMMFKDLIDRARWTGLIQYNNIRVSKRIMRYYSYVYGIDI